MLSNGYATPEQLKMLSRALTDYCQAKGIEKNTPDYEEAAKFVLLLFKYGASIDEELSRYLAMKRSPF